MSDAVDWQALYDLCRRSDDAATRELVDHLESGREYYVREAGRALAHRDVPDDLRDRVIAGLLAGDRARIDTFAAGARALVRHPRAVALAEPLLRVDVASSADAWDLADHVLRAIESELGRHSVGRAPLPDPRFRALAAEVVRMNPDRASDAETIVDAYRHFDGEDVTPPWRLAEFVPDEILPLIVAGLRLVDGVHLLDLPRGYPPGLAKLSHQFGGYTCDQEMVFGYVVAVPEDLVVSMLDVDRGFDGSHGERMQAADLALANARLPLFAGTITQGAEGLLLATTRPAGLVGLGLVHFGSKLAPWRWGVDVDATGDYVFAGHYGEEHERALDDIGTRYGLAPCTAVILENCD